MSVPIPLKGKEYWRSIEEIAESPDFLARLHREFPAGASELTDPISRRTFLGLMGASISLAYLTGCRRPVEEIVPYVKPPEEVVLGQPLQYATLMPWGATSLGVLATAREGRPVKVDGNPLHPSTRGGSNVFIQASVLNLYDPDRSQQVLHNGKAADWTAFISAWRGQKEKYDANGGEGLAVLSGESSSPTLARLKAQFAARYPNAQWVVWEPVSDENILRGLNEAFGADLMPVHRFERAKVIFALDSDFLSLESGAITAAKGFADGRRIQTPHDPMNRLYVIENGFTLTGAMADHRKKLSCNRMSSALLQLARALTQAGVNLNLDLPNEREVVDTGWMKAAARDLAAHAGECLIVAGRRQPLEVHALVAALNHALGNTGQTIYYRPVQNEILSDNAKLRGLASDIFAGKVTTLAILGGNPVYWAPADLNFREALGRVANVIHLNEFIDETARHAEWHLPQSHWLESWGDGCSTDGTASVTQPLIEPLYDTRSPIEFIHLLTTGLDERGYDRVVETWRERLGIATTELRWREILHDGLIKDSALEPAEVKLQLDHITAWWRQVKPNNDDGLEVVFSPSSSVWDGRFANNGWLQELPDPITKLMWDNAALMSARTAERLGLENMDLVRLDSDGRSVEAPVWIVPGHPDDSIGLTLGYGRSNIGRVADGAGFNAYNLRALDGLWFASGVKVTKIGQKRLLSSSQDHWLMEGRPLVREAALDEYRRNPHFAAEMVETGNLQSLWKEHTYEEGYQWGMAIDLNACIGCNACTISCQSENNIPIVGREAAGYGREMHWIRLDRYFTGDLDDPQMVSQPVGCQHCEMAPCEQVCPVAATVHDGEGLNVMVYNRCVGTRYCSNNCPYKVRRFNFFNWTKQLPATVKMAQNPDVTVRSRGVMEKCTYCIQRINRGKFAAKRDGRRAGDGEIVTACQEACPTDAIVFGNINDPNSRVSKLKQGERNYQMLAEFNTRPRTSYLARIRNPNPEIIAAEL